MNHPGESDVRKESHDGREIGRSQAFRDLIALKRAFIVPALVFFLLHYLGLAVQLGQALWLADLRVIDAVNVAYLFALAQFVLGWVIAALYLLVSARFDALADGVLAQLEKQRSGR
jgi:uncharacterized membrane protein (DUF485 family)